MQLYNQNSVFEKIPKLVEIEMEDHLRARLIRAMHMHEDRVEIRLVRNGKGQHTVGGCTYTIGPGDILVYNAGVLHDECPDPQEGMDIFSCSVRDVRIKGLQENHLLPEGSCPVIQSGVYSAEIEALLSMLYTANLTMRAEEKQKEVDKELTTYLLFALLLIIRKADDNKERTMQGEKQDLVKQILDYIDAHYLEQITVNDMSRDLNLSRYYLSHVFKEAVGYSPMQYVIRRRIGEAQNWLLMSDKSVTDIAYIVGYNSASNFNNAFQKMIGLTPQRYREHWRNIRKSSDQSRRSE